MIIVLIFILYPFYSMALSSLKTTKELYNIHVNPLWVFKPTLENYVYLFTQTNYLRWYLNSAIVALTTTPISILVSILAAYALARLEFFGSKTLGIGIFIVYLIPQTLLFIPLARVINSMGVSNTLWSLILTYPTFQIPFSTWLLMGYFRGLPKEIEDAARVDGASRLKTLWTIVVPMSLPAIVTVTLFCFTLSWGELIYALTFISDSLKQTLSVGTTTELIRGDMFFWGPLMAGGLLAAIPVVLAFSFLVDYYISGLAAGSIK
ncbi:MAG TPA: carbohydrate ABC transporter permease [Thermotoga sp.]|nr:MAG: carbohydrate ABC transporter permease [Thermotoga sp.]HDG61374.1 carbohydrate ABC transporter permease [Thermotoga sp.]